MKKKTMISQFFQLFWRSLVTGFVIIHPACGAPQGPEADISQPDEEIANDNDHLEITGVISETPDSEEIDTIPPPPPSRLPVLPDEPLSDRGGPGRQGAIAATGPRESPDLRLKLRLSGEIRSAPAASKNRLIFATRNGRLFSIDPQTGATGWRVRTLAIRGSGPAIGDGAVFVAEVARGGRLHAVELETGASRWTTRIGPTTVSPVIAGGIVVIGSDDLGGLASFATDNGDAGWRITLDELQGSPATDGERLYASSLGAVGAWSLDEGRPIWTHETSSAPSTPAVLGDLLVVTLDDGDLVALSASDGTIRWQRPGLGDTLGLASLDTENVVVVAGNEIIASSAHDGSETWRAPALEGTSVTIAGDVLYALTAPTVVAAYDRRQGNLLWTYELDREAGALPVVAHGALWLALRVDLEGEAWLLALE